LTASGIFVRRTKMLDNLQMPAYAALQQLVQRTNTQEIVMTDAKQTVEMMNEFGTRGYETLRELGELQMGAWNLLMEKQMSAFNAVVDTAVAQVQLASEGKDYQEVLSGQVELSRKLADDMMATSRETVELVQETTEKLRGWAEGATKQATEQAEKVAKQAA
jgi:hypothetical protein